MKGKIYRSEIPKSRTSENPHQSRSTTRPPGNVPYLVDNLWEWKRPDEFPNRRHSVYASPSQESARSSGPNNGTVYCVEFVGNYKICQLKELADSKFHHECKSLPKILIDSLGQKWVRLPAARGCARQLPRQAQPQRLRTFPPSSDTAARKSPSRIMAGPTFKC